MSRSVQRFNDPARLGKVMLCEAWWAGSGLGLRLLLSENYPRRR